MLNHTVFKVFFFFIACMLLACPAWSSGKGFYPDGQIKWEYLFKEGQLQEAKWYSAEGQLVSREIYVDGKAEKTEGYRADGSLEWQIKQLAENRQEVTRIDSEGKVTARYEMLDDQPDGTYTAYFPNGQIKQIVTYRNGTLEGPATTFFPSGQKEHEFSYVNGQVDGPYRTYSEVGTLLTEYSFSQGQVQ